MACFAAQDSWTLYMRAWYIKYMILYIMIDCMQGIKKLGYILQEALYIQRFRIQSIIEAYMQNCVPTE